MTTYKLNIKKLLTATIIMLSALSLPYTALADGKSGGGSETAQQNTNCSKDCSQAWSNVSNGGCKVDTNSGGKIVGSASNKLDTTCLQNASKNSCFDSVPIDGGSGSYNTIGSRNNGTRNHYGTDIGANNTTSAKAYSVAEGQVVEYAPSTGGGNTMVINHPTKCSGGLGSHKGYHSVYRHLFKSLVGVGTKVKTRNEGGPAIGIVGGSNYKDGKLCQNPKQQNTGCSKGGVGGAGYYDIHLHLEIQAGLYSAGSGTQAKTSLTLQPYCQNIGVLCGGCPMPKKCGLHSGAPIPYGDASSIQNPGEGDSAGRETPDNADVQDEGQCSLSKFLDSENCIFCGLFKTIFNAASSIAKSAMDGLAVPSKKIVGIGFLIWILLYLFKQIATPSGASTGEMLKGILFQGFRVAVVIIILTSALYSTMDLTLNPVLQTGLNFAQNLADFSKCPADAEYMKDINGYDSTKGYEDSSSTGGLSIEVGKAFVCSVKNMEDNLGVLMSVGKYLLCVSWNEEAWPGEIMFINAKLIPHLGYFFNGLAYYIVGLMLVLCAPWCLIDCVLQLCIAAGLIPCAIAAFAFKSTEKYLKIIWNFFMNSMFNFVFMAVILCIINSYIISWLKLNPDQFDKTAFIDTNRLAIYGIDGGGFGGIVILGICFICWSFFGEA
ncbi:MAG: M23 family metallopeptidase, partial [Alphaproteobacteria bacterium]|nr:M23 family metallopeptidase [Alphaproteobacteria bacterium]